MKIKYQIFRMNNTVESVHLIYQVPPKQMQIFKETKTTDSGKLHAA